MIKYFIIILIVILVAGSAVKNLYWPPIHYDSIAGYHLMAKAMAEEKTLNVSLFKNDLAGNRGSYPPLVPVSYAICMWLGINDKIPNTTYFIMLLGIFYIISRKYVKEEIALLFTLLLCTSPEIFAHSSLSLTNLPAAMFVAGGFLFAYDKKWMLSAIMYGLAGFTRPDAIGFIIVGIMWMMFYGNRAHFLIYAFIALTPFIFWNIYLMKVIGITPDRFRQIDFAPERILWMMKYIVSFITSLELYGIVFYLFMVALIIGKLKDRKTLIYIGLSLLIFFAGYYMLDPVKMGCIPDKLMTAGFRRGLMYFVPLMLFYCTGRI